MIYRAALKRADYSLKRMDSSSCIFISETDVRGHKLQTQLTKKSAASGRIALWTNKAHS